MISIINSTELLKSVAAKGPVTSPQYFIGKSNSFHPQGLYSEDIFGVESSPERRKSFSWIELNTNIIHPVIYDIISKRIERKIPKMLSGEISLDINDDGSLVEANEGDGLLTGMTNLYENIDKIKFRRSDEESDRNLIIDMIEKNIKTGKFFMNRLVVIPPEYRPIEILDNDVNVDEISEAYRRIIMLAHQLKSVSGELYNILSYRMQGLMVEFYDLIKDKSSKKSGIIRNLMLGKRVDFSARSVITPGPDLELGEVGIPLRMVCSIFEPFLIYGLINSPESKRLPDEFHEEVRKFLGKEIDVDLIM